MCGNNLIIHNRYAISFHNHSRYFKQKIVDTKYANYVYISSYTFFFLVLSYETFRYALGREMESQMHT